MTFEFYHQKSGKHRLVGSFKCGPKTARLLLTALAKALIGDGKVVYDSTYQNAAFQHRKGTHCGYTKKHSVYFRKTLKAPASKKKS